MTVLAPKRVLVDQRTGLVALIVALVLVFGSLRAGFFDERFVLFPLLRDITTLTVVGLAQLAVLSIGHLNIAVGRMAAFGAMFMGLAYDNWHLPLYAGLAVGLLAGAAIGALTGLIITTSGVNSFVVTLAMDFALLGLISLVYSEFTTSAAFVSKPAGMAELRQYSLADVCAGDLCGSGAVPQLFVFALIAMALVGYLFRRARAGREMLMVGTNPVAAELSGIDVPRRIVGAHALSGALAALAGFLLAVTSGSFTAGIGSEFMLPSFLGPVLGGTLLTGGAVSILGTFLGTSLTQVIRQGLTMLGASVESLSLSLGAILLAALSLDRIRHVIGERRAVRR
ncbi:ribose transport system permease protein [Amycolatopsis xylanica]|uniref:Ribose transport system permease protein n=1 Tax=Amycolatopsis xylanica TaxID=589385 RepID=A0A1H2T2N5_9PSEU|nr:ABC transporter permease [Amycolatopsis xylanica]SDW38203.1 ribose transport system permease protein [Amycolatopsis xylanica]